MDKAEKQTQLGHRLKIFLTIFFLLIFIAGAVFFIHEYRAGHFESAETFKSYIEGFGIYGPIMLMFIQCIKVLYTIIPGAIGCIGGAMLFGPWVGFICSYIGICAGSIISFTLSRHLGVSFVQSLMGQRNYDRSMKWLNKRKKSYPIFLWLAICFPFSPDDFLCFFSGLTNISYKKFIIIILTAKPWTVLGYSLIFGNLG